MNIKYPRTHHLPWSPGATSDDKILRDLSDFENKQIIITEKYDGENCTLTRNGLYARSLSSNGGILRERVKKLWAEKCFLIPEGWRICGENMQWQHSIRYEKLESPFYIFSIWDEYNICLDWDMTTEIAYGELNIPCVPVIYDGIFCENYIKNLDICDTEGYVVRNKDSFHYDDFTKNVAKYVRSNHVQTDEHWTKNLIENGFK